MRMKTREIHTIHKKITLFASLLFLCCFNSACLFRSYLEEATEYVQEHEDESRRLIEEHEENDPEGARFRSHTEDWAYAEFVLGGISMGDGSILWNLLSVINLLQKLNCRYRQEKPDL